MRSPNTTVIWVPRIPSFTLTSRWLRGKSVTSWKAFDHKEQNSGSIRRRFWRCFGCEEWNPTRPAGMQRRSIVERPSSLNRVALLSMFKSHKIGWSVVLNWMALAVSISVAFFLSPFVVHNLGNVAYGIWTLVNSMIAYMGLLDLGMRGAVTRFVSRHHSQGEHLASSRAVSAAFWLRATIGFAVLCGALILPSIAISIFDIPADMQMATRLTLGVVGASFAVTLTFGVFGGVLAALQRFDLISGVGIVQTLFRAGGAIWLLKSGHGIVSLAVWELIVVVLANIALTTLALRVYRDLQLLIRPPDSEIGRAHV